MLIHTFNYNWNRMRITRCRKILGLIGLDYRMMDECFPLVEAFSSEILGLSIMYEGIMHMENYDSCLLLNGNKL